MRSRIGRFLIACAVSAYAWALVGCGSSGEPVKTPSVADITPGALAEKITPLAENSNEKPGGAVPTIVPRGPVTISFAGDVVCDDRFLANYQAADNNISGVVSEAVYEALSGADICVINHEYCCTDIDESNKLDYQLWIEHAPTKNEDMFKELGADIACVANNHAFDYGEQGFLDTLEELKKRDIEPLGAGLNIYESVKPVIREEGGKSIAFFASNSIITKLDWIAGENKPGMNALYEWSNTYTLMVEEIKKAKESCDLVVCLLHFGLEKTNDFHPEQQLYARALIDAGVDVIIGDHAHVLQGMEYYNGGVIFYGMSNFIFSPYHSDTMVVTLSLYQDNTYDFKILPCSSDVYYTKETSSSVVFDTINEHSVNAYVDSNGVPRRTD